jgi:geranylgeranyl diphosphate synthase, type I
MTPSERLGALRTRIDAALSTALDEHGARLGQLDPGLAPLLDELRRFVLAGGKRLRPTLVLLGYEAAGRTDLSGALAPALAVELVHTAALIHDDIIDRAPARRGAPTSQQVFAELHAERGWRGDPTRFGDGSALLLGDLALILADRVFLEGDGAQDRPGATGTAFATFTTLREEVTLGQFLDVLAAQRRDATTQLALAIAGLKSGRYSVARPLQLGAELAGDATLATALYRFGLPLGQAFQLRDDVLGVFGDETETGKSARSDLVEGKHTHLVEATQALLPPADRQRFVSLLGDPAIGAPEVAEARRLMRDSGGLAATEARIRELVATALDALDRLSLPADAGATLRELASFLAVRRS